tara:strand:+ start:750 stop:1532 length:783 start_codon:yes stop_codon:yes gene_type:complete
MKLSSYLISILFFFISISSAENNQFSIINSEELKLGDKLQETGLKLISLPLGLTLIKNNTDIDLLNENTIIINIHGTRSRGYEWVGPLKKLSEKYSNNFFYKHDWNICPDSTSSVLSRNLVETFSNFQNADTLVIFGHSYGGLIATFLASKLHLNIPIYVNTIASPLTGYKKLSNECGLKVDRDDNIIYPLWDKNIIFHQWRTQFELDNAFNKLSFDPQDIKIYNDKITRLPSTMNGRRLGHNWSITWVVDEFLNILHLP